MKAMLYTIGHGTLEVQQFAGLLALAGIEQLVDVRSAPGSRHNPQFGRSRMEEWLPPHGVAYRWEADLGGFRRPQPNSANTGLRHSAFRGYADHMETPAFGLALDRLLAEAAAAPSVVMCSETLWWRCHRRLLADAVVLLTGMDVAHLTHDGKTRPHVLTACACLKNGNLSYPPAAFADPR